MSHLSLVDICMQISPEITPHASSFVHHMLVYLCPTQLGLTEEHVGLSGHCHTLPRNVGGCLAGLLIGGWAVGGDVSELHFIIALLTLINVIGLCLS